MFRGNKEECRFRPNAAPDDDLRGSGPSVEFDRGNVTLEGAEYTYLSGIQKKAAGGGGGDGLHARRTGPWGRG